MVAMMAAVMDAVTDRAAMEKLAMKKAPESDTAKVTVVPEVAKVATVAALFGALLLAGCASTGARPSAAAHPGQVATWYSPPAQYPGICMRLMADGGMHFDGGFGFFNPGHWAYDGAATELRLHLGGTEPFPSQLVNEQLMQQVGGLVRADAVKRTLVYRVGPATDTLELGGFVFYRNLACDGAVRK